MEKKRAYEQRIRDVEFGSFFSTTGPTATAYSGQKIGINDRRQAGATMQGQLMQKGVKRFNEREPRRHMTVDHNLQRSQNNVVL